MSPIRNISYLLPMRCSFWEKCINSQKTGLGCSTPLRHSPVWILFDKTYFLSSNFVQAWQPFTIIMTTWLPIEEWRSKSSIFKSSDSSRYYRRPYFCRYCCRYLYSSDRIVRHVLRHRHKYPSLRKRRLLADRPGIDRPDKLPRLVHVYHRVETGE